MKWLQKHKGIVVEVICYLFILLFVYAAVSKLLDFENFRVQLGQSPLLSVYAGWVAWAVPLFENVIALMLVFRATRLIGLIGAFALMFTFTAYIYIILNYSSFIPCSCGGILEKLGWTEHLIFNLLFVLLAIIGIVLSIDYRFWLRQHSKLLVSGTLSFIALIGIGMVSLLFISSEKQMHHENPFVRRYPHHPATKTHELNIGANSYYIAGKNGDKIYLGNYTAPLHLLEVDTILKDTQHIRLSMEGKKGIPFRAVQVRVTPPYFNVMDGTVPCIFQGFISDWKAKLVMKDNGYFSLIEPITANDFVIRARSGKTGENELGLIRAFNTSQVKLFPSLLEKQIDGVFDTDGTLLYNSELQKSIYVYYYRNEFIVINANMELDYRGKTIDTVSRARIKIIHLTEENSRTMAAPPLMVNRKATTSGNYLFIQSELLGRYESKKMMQQASIIDVYDLKQNIYKFSFYIYHQNQKKLRQFKVYDNLLVALIDDSIITYLLRPQYFITTQNQ